MTLTLTEASGKAVVSSFPLSRHALAETANRGPRQQGRQARCSCPPHDGASSRPWYLEETAINLTLIHSIGFCSGLSVFSPAWKPCLLSTLKTFHCFRVAGELTESRRGRKWRENRVVSRPHPQVLCVQKKKKKHYQRLWKSLPLERWP